MKKYWLLLLTGFLFGSQFLIIKFALHDFTALDVGMIRVVVGTLTVALLVPFFREGKSPLCIPWYQYAIIGFLEGTLPCLLVPWGQQYMATSLSSVLISTMPIFTFILGFFFIRNHRLTLLDVVSIVAGFVGVAILISPVGGGSGGSWLTALLPELAILIASASWALSLLLINKLPEAPPIRLTRNILIAASIQIFIVWLVASSHSSTIHFGAVSLFASITLGVFSSGVVYIFYVLLIRLGGVHFAAFTNYLVPVFGILLGVVFLSEKITAQRALGCAIVILALLLQSWKDLKVKSAKRV